MPLKKSNTSFYTTPENEKKSSNEDHKQQGDSWLHFFFTLKADALIGVFQNTFSNHGSSKCCRELVDQHTEQMCFRNSKLEYSYFPQSYLHSFDRR